MQPRSLDEKAFQALINNGEILEQDGEGLKVIHLISGKILKIFKNKHWFSKSTIFPEYKQFVKHAHKLNKLGFNTVDIIECLYFPSLSKYAVLYNPIPGRCFREIYQKNDNLSKEQCRAIGKLICELHNNGIYFRSLHLGNIIETDNQEPGLIDIADLRSSRFSLPLIFRKRNLNHLLRYTADASAIFNHHIKDFIDGYASALNKPSTRHSHLLEKIQKHITTYLHNQ